MLRLRAQRQFSRCVTRCHASAAHGGVRPFQAASSNARRGPPPARAVPSPASEVISEEDAETVRKLDELFRMADTDGNGRIDRDELKVLLSSVEGGYATLFALNEALSDEQVDETMAKYDKDASGDIDQEEFKALVYDGLLLEGTLAEYEAAFQAADASGNGTIGANELGALFKALGAPLSNDKIADVMMAYDRDESGQIDFTEFLAMFRDQLLDLRAIQSWMHSQPQQPAASGDDARLMQTEAGTLSLIFSGEELQEVLDKHRDQLVVLMCGMTWCRPCKGVQRPVERLADKYHVAVFVKFYGNANARCKALLKELKIRSTPSFVMFRGGEVVDAVSGANKSRIEEHVRRNLREEEMPPGAWLYPPA